MRTITLFNNTSFRHVIQSLNSNHKRLLIKIFLLLKRKFKSSAYIKQFHILLHFSLDFSHLWKAFWFCFESVSKVNCTKALSGFSSGICVTRTKINIYTVSWFKLCKNDTDTYFSWLTLHLHTVHTGLLFHHIKLCNGRGFSLKQHGWFIIFQFI